MRPPTTGSRIPGRETERHETAASNNGLPRFEIRVPTEVGWNAMTLHDVREALLKDLREPKEIRTHDGRAFLVRGVERWMISGASIFLTRGTVAQEERISIRNIASVGPPSRRSR